METVTLQATCNQRGCHASAVPNAILCERHTPKVTDPEIKCMSCGGTGTFAKRWYEGDETPGKITVEWVPCWFCAATGDRRSAPEEWKRCPSNAYRVEDSPRAPRAGAKRRP